MRRYSRPVMQVEKFSAKNAVATGCSEQSYVNIPEQTVNCIIEGSETTFVSGSCSKVGAGVTGTYNNQYIYVWYNGSISGQPSADQTATLSAMEQAVGWSSAVGKSGYHAGYISSEIYKKMNSTS